jgi:myo-inositol 2-dehydrogenase / D-chiro-inositol 1-dehydrogenase
MVAAFNETPDRTFYSNADGVHSAKPLYFFLERYMTSFIDEMKEFVDALCTGRTPSVTGIDGRIPVVIAMAATRSYKENRPIKICEIE